MNLIPIEGGVCAAKGLQAAGVHCGIRKTAAKKDLALIYSQTSAPLPVPIRKIKCSAPPSPSPASMWPMARPRPSSTNSGNANTCNANGVEIAEKTCALTAEALGISAEDVVVASTGVIGQPLSIDPIAAGLPVLASQLSVQGSTTPAKAS